MKKKKERKVKMKGYQSSHMHRGCEETENIRERKETEERKGLKAMLLYLRNRKYLAWIIQTMLDYL